MTKARTRAQRRRSKAAKPISLPGGETVPQRPAHPRDRRHTAPETAEDALRTAVVARIRHGAPKEQALAPMSGDHVGLCIMALVERRDWEHVWQTWCAVTAARRNFRLRIIGSTGEPQNAAIAMMPEAMQTDPSAKVDTREPDEKDRDAARAWASWKAAIKALPAPQMAWAVRDAIDGFGPPLWRDGAPTSKGRAVVQALEKLTEER
jgi:hypothetical protein